MIFYQENEFDNGYCKEMLVLSRPQYVNEHKQIKSSVSSNSLLPIPLVLVINQSLSSTCYGLQMWLDFAVI